MPSQRLNSVGWTIGKFRDRSSLVGPEMNISLILVVRSLEELGMVHFLVLSREWGNYSYSNYWQKSHSPIAIHSLLQISITNMRHVWWNSCCSDIVDWAEFSQWSVTIPVQQGIWFYDTINEWGCWPVLSLSCGYSVKRRSKTNNLNMFFFFSSRSVQNTPEFSTPGWTWLVGGLEHFYVSIDWK